MSEAKINLRGISGQTREGRHVCHVLMTVPTATKPVELPWQQALELATQLRHLAKRAETHERFLNEPDAVVADTELLVRNGINLNPGVPRAVMGGINGSAVGIPGVRPGKRA